MDDAVPPSKESHTLHQSNFNTISRHRFEIKEEVRMVAPRDSVKSSFVNESLSGPNANEWMNTMKDEMEYMQTNQV